MPSGPAVSVTGPWVADSARPACVECHKHFGVFTRRHHCRRCGEVFCAKCSKYVSKDIPGLESYRGNALRVCKCCFLRHLAFMVVARGAFSVKFELFGSRGDAEHYYARLKRSKMIIAMRNAQTITSYYESHAVRQRLQHKAQGARNYLLGGHQVAAQLVPDRLDTSHVSFNDASPVRATAGAWTMIFVAEITGSSWSYHVREVRGAADRQQMVEEFNVAVKANKAVTKAVILSLRGLAVMSAYGSGALTRTAAVVASAQNFVRSQPCFMVLHVGGHCTTRRHVNIHDGLASIDQLPSECSALLMTPRFEILARHRCDIETFVDELKNYAGNAVLPQLHQASRVAVVSARDVITVTSNFNTALAAARGEALTHGQQRVIAVVALANEDAVPDEERPSGAATARSANGAAPNGGSGSSSRGSPDVRSTNTHTPRTQNSASGSGALPPPTIPTSSAESRQIEELAASLRILHVHADDPAKAVLPVRDVIPAHRWTQAARALVTAVRTARPGTDEIAAAGGDPDDIAGRRRSISPQNSFSGSAPNPHNMEVLTCTVCMEEYNAQERRPVLCPSCGNTICFHCWQQTRFCPLSRCDKPAKPVFNIALVQLLDTDGFADNRD